MITIVIITLEVLFIAYLVWDNVSWQKRLLKSLNATPKPKPKYKLKKGQKVAFGDDNPFQEEM